MDSLRLARPAPTKHIAQINHAGDAMLAILQDSSTTSSSEEKSPSHPRSASIQSPLVLPVMPGEVTAVPAMPTAMPPSPLPAASMNQPKSRPVTAITRSIVPPNRIMTAPHRITPYITHTAPDDEDDAESMVDDTPKRDLSPIIIKDTINTGSANRLNKLIVYTLILHCF